MSESKKENKKSGLAIGGGALLGIGIGFFFFPIGVFGHTSVFAFVGSILAGLGLGLIVAAKLTNSQKEN